MKIAKVKISQRSSSPLSFSKFHFTPPLSKELPKDYEERTWRERVHTNGENQLVLPGIMVKKALETVGKYLGRDAQIPGGGKSTYTKHFVAGVICTEAVPIKDASGNLMLKDQIEGEWNFVPSDGKKGGDKRVQKKFPLIKEWLAELTFHITDDMITQDVFKKFLDQAGLLIGVGRFRPANGGFYGMFKVDDIEWKDNS
jgi:hypothetical protein